MSILLTIIPATAEKRPNRPKEKLQKDPAKTEQHLHPVDLSKFEPLLIKYRNIKPNER